MTESIVRTLNLIQKMLLNMAAIAAIAALVFLGPVKVNQTFAQATSLTTTVNQTPDIADTWQGTLHAGKDLRLVFKVMKADGGGYKAVFYSIDQSGQGFPVSKITLDSSVVKLLTTIGISYEGKLSADGKSIVGNFIQGNPLPLTLIRATPETEWTIPEPPPVIPPMAENTDPSFEVATIKPNNSGATSLQGLTVNGRNFATRNSSLRDLIEFAYNMQEKQIISGPDWLDKD